MTCLAQAHRVRLRTWVVCLQSLHLATYKVDVGSDPGAFGCLTSEPYERQGLQTQEGPVLGYRAVFFLKLLNIWLGSPAVIQVKPCRPSLQEQAPDPGRVLSPTTRQVLSSSPQPASL